MTVQNDEQLPTSITSLARNLYVDATHLARHFTLNHASSPGSTTATLFFIVDCVRGIAQRYQQKKPSNISTQGKIRASLDAKRATRGSVVPHSIFTNKSQSQTLRDAPSHAPVQLNPRSQS